MCVCVCAGWEVGRRWKLSHERTFINVVLACLLKLFPINGRQFYHRRVNMALILNIKNQL